METIRRNLALADMDIRRDEHGHRRIFSIKFVSKEGKSTLSRRHTPVVPDA